jgi:hypothetical protein
LLNAGTAPQQAINTLNQYGGGFQGAAYYNDARGQTIGLNSVNGYLNRRPEGSWELVMRPSAEGGGGQAPALPNSFASLVQPPSSAGPGAFTPSQLPVGTWNPMTPIQFGPLPTLPFPTVGPGSPSYQPSAPWAAGLPGMPPGSSVGTPGPYAGPPPPTATGQPVTYPMGSAFPPGTFPATYAYSGF